VTALLELRPQVLEVVDLAVEDDAHLAVLVVDGLIATHDVDNREPPHRQPNIVIPEHTLAIGAAMMQRIVHPQQRGAVRSQRAHDAADAAHWDVE